jgi:hypothetical protein
LKPSCENAPSQSSAFPTGCGHTVFAVTGDSAMERTSVWLSQTPCPTPVETACASPRASHRWLRVTKCFCSAAPLQAPAACL